MGKWLAVHNQTQKNSKDKTEKEEHIGKRETSGPPMKRCPQSPV